MEPCGNMSSKLRKGAWTTEEDMLLTNYIQKYGEGKWHQVALKAGLNRCRRSCRLRWLNYLSPNIKRGDLEEDEIDLMHRLHKLLGNRWSLIAGRIPGRTANDVKNYWNTHFRSRNNIQKTENKDAEPSQHNIVSIIKPQPHTLPKTSNTYPHTKPYETGNAFKKGPMLVSSPTICDDMIKEYMELEKETANSVVPSLRGFSMETEGFNVVGQEGGQNTLSNFPMDDLMWERLHYEP